jgi:hypothetical protein
MKKFLALIRQSRRLGEKEVKHNSSWSNDKRKKAVTKNAFEMSDKAPGMALMGLIF